MTPQSQFFVIAPIARGREAELRARLEQTDRRARATPGRTTRRCPSRRFDTDALRPPAHPRRPDARRRARSTAGRASTIPLSLAFAGEVDGELDDFFAAVADGPPRA